MAEYSQTYWNVLIDQYRNGTISDQDRFQIEKQALDDPFLFDALEGISLYGNVDVENKEGQNSRKIFTLPRIAMAASIVLLVAFMFSLKMNSDTQIANDNPIAMVLEDEEGEAPTESKNKDINSVVSSRSESVNNGEVKQIGKDSNKTPSKIVKEKPKKEKVGIKIIENSAPVSNSTMDIAEANKYKKREKSGDDENDDVQDEIQTSVEMPSANQAKEEIVDISNAANFEKGTKNEDAELIVPVSSDADFKEEVDSKRKKSKAAAFFEAVPVIGKEIFDDYAKERIDKRGLRQAKPQDVTIEFTIDKNGNLTNFRHIFSGCPECGPFAISILQNSGEWKTVPPGFSGKARYTFIF